MLFLVGTGIAYNDISIRAAERCKGCDVYIERYTSLVDDEKVRYLSELFGKKISFLNREDLEEKAKEIVARAASKNIAILVGGDPLTATTHKILFIEAKKQSVGVEVLHSSSAISAITGESGLDFYRFGQVCTIPRWSDRYKPVSFYETIERNLSHNLHSLVLLDYYPEKGSTLSLHDAVNELLAAEEFYKKGIIEGGTKVMTMRNIGLSNQEVKMTTIEEAKAEVASGMFAVIFPAKLSEVEKETIDGMTMV